MTKSSMKKTLSNTTTTIKSSNKKTTSNKKATTSSKKTNNSNKKTKTSSSSSSSSSSSNSGTNSSSSSSSTITMKLDTLKKSLWYMYVGELKEVCSKKLKISDSGDKRLLVPKIVEYLKSGKILTKPAIPDASTAKVHGKDKGTPTKPGNLVLFGVYKNDLVTREYMKTLVGPHFHFKAYLLDWMKQCWEKGEPPTYKEYADLWIKHDKDPSLKSTYSENSDHLQFNQFKQNMKQALDGDALQKAWLAEKAKRKTEALKIVDEILLGRK